MDNSHLCCSAGIWLDERMWCKLLVQRARYLESLHPFRNAGGVDRHFHLPGICHPYARRPLLRHFLLCHLRPSCVVAFRHHIQPSEHQRFPVVDCDNPLHTLSARRICKICHSIGYQQVYEFIRIQYTPYARLCVFVCHRHGTHGLYCHAA